MRNSLRASLLVSLLFASPILRDARSAKPDTSQPSPAAKLVRDALAADVQGDRDSRDKLLAEAVQADPNYAPARWQLGQVFVNGKWVNLDDVPRQFAGDRKLAAYRKRREALVESADSHRELARWCGKNNLRDEAQVHWNRVLEFDRQDAEAIGALGLAQQSAQQLKREQNEARRNAAAENRKVLQKWQPQLERWQKVFAGDDPDAVQQALGELTAIQDPADLPALFTALSLDRAGRQGTAVRDTVFEALGKIRSPAVTQYFLQIALNSEPSETRDAAIAQLGKRPPYTYVPQLLAALPPKLTSSGEFYVLPGGTVVHEQKVSVDSKDAEYTYSYENVVHPTDAAMAARVTPRAVNRELQKASTLDAQVRAAQQQAEQRRGRIQEVLTRATEFGSNSGSVDWEKQYEDYYGIYTPAMEKQYYAQHIRAYEAYATTPVRTVNTTSRVAANPITSVRHECFAAGTTVATLDGPRSIESLRMGDRVLAQDIVTGELTFKPLLQTTLRPATEMIEIRCGTSKPILAAAGHPFWVVDQGWQIARLLKPGDRLHSVSGTITVDSVESKPAAEAYNLVVGEFHTYFVGDDRLLVHDNAPLIEQPQSVPGL